MDGGDSDIGQLAQISAIPYGAPTLEATDHKLLTNSLLAQIKDADLDQPAQLNLFPKDRNWLARQFHDVKRFVGDRILRRNLGFLTPANGPQQGLTDFENDTVTGISRDSDIPYVMRRELELPPFSGRCNSVFDRNRPGFQAIAALHEFSHEMDSRLGLTSTIMDGMTNDKKYNPGDGTYPVDPTIMQANIAERIADASAALYVRSNYGSGALLDRVPDLREAEVYDITHSTASSVKAALADFDKNPVRGLSIVETSKRAAAIVTAQPELWNELLDHSAASNELAGGFKDPMGDPSSPFYNPEVFARVSTDETAIRDARDRVCKKPAAPPHMAP